MNGVGERSAERSSETIRGKGSTWKYCRNREHSIDILIEKKITANFQFVICMEFQIRRNHLTLYHH